jgi:23S rRNA U2552 (ribose-2'-O)-methylase RlmE/FtsJ
MIYFLLPKTNHLLYKEINCLLNEDIVIPSISTSLAYYLYDIKEKINNYEKDWDMFKKYTNPYEYIHTNVALKKRSVAKHRPLSRSYFKMIELTNTFGLHNYENPIKTFHLAEGPGGFIEAILHCRSCPQDIYIGMTLNDYENTDEDVPGWKKSEYFTKENPNVHIENGADGTGNILSLENLEYCKKKYGSSMELITADGGFDFSVNFNQQEMNMTKLLFAQVCFALCMQKKDGAFILKIFDCFTDPSIDILCILSSFYKKVYITKPQTSRYANSEKYILCKGFLYDKNTEFYPYLYAAFDKMLKNNNNVHRFLSISVSHYFTTKLEEYNSIFGQQQIENIFYTISLIENKNKTEKINNLIKTNVQKSTYWCIKNNVQYNQVFGMQYTNILPSHDSFEKIHMNKIDSTNDLDIVADLHA